MRSLRYLKALCCLILCLSGFSVHRAYADHISSTEMYLDYVGTGPGDLRYKVTFITFRICILDNLVLSPTVEIHVRSAQAGPASDTRITLYNETLRHKANGDPVYEDTLDNLCPNFSRVNSCRVTANVNYSGYTMRRYSAIVTLPSRQTDWLFSWSSCCRLLSFANIDYTGDAFYLEVGLNNSFRYDNSTPRYNGQPFAFLCANQPGSISNLPADPNPGDSLVTFKMDPQQSVSQDIVYSPGFSSARPMGASGNYVVGRTSGKATFIPPLQGRYALAFRTEDYDKATGTRLSYTSRDLVITVLNCTNLPPYIDSVPNLVTGVRGVDTTGGEVTLMACLTPMSFVVNAHSNTPSGLIYLRPAGKLPSGMTMTPSVTGGTGSVIVQWTPKVRDTGKHVITIIAVDSTCAPGQEITLRNEFTFTIDVDDILHTSQSLTRLTTCELQQNGIPLSSTQPTGSYRWNTGDTTRSINPKSTGYYICTAVNACMIATDSFLVVEDTLGIPSPPALRDTTVCQHVAAPLIHVKDTGVVWYESGSGGGGSSTQPFIPTSSPGRMVLYAARRERNCLSDRAPVNITVMRVPVRGRGDTLVRCRGVINYAEPIGAALAQDVHYRWNTGSKSSYIVPQNDGAFFLTTYNGCGSVTDTFIVRSEDCEDCVSFPDAFSPNGDGRNDAFGPMIRCDIDRYSLSIFNRWGQLVFVSRDRNLRWQGGQGGIAAPAGTYMYMASMYSAHSGKKIFVKGELTLVR